MSKRKNHSRSKPGISRKNFIKIAAFGGMGLAALGGGYMAFKDTEDLSFLELTREHVVPRIVPGWTEIEERYVPIGKENKYIAGSAEFERMRGAAMNYISSRRALLDSRSAGPPYDLDLYFKLYGVPAEQKLARSALTFCRRAEELLHTKIKGFNVPPIDWKIIGNGENYQQHFDNKGIITAGYYQVNYITLKDSAGTMVIKNAHPTFNGGGRNLAYESPVSGKRSLFLIVSANRGMVITPFSEIIPMAITTQAKEYTSKHGYEESRAVGEAFAEGISYVLSTELLKNMGAENPERYPREIYNEILTDPIYKYAGAAILWAKKYGVQATFDMYMHDTERYARELKKHGPIIKLH